MRLGRYSPMQLAYLQCHYPPNSCLMLDSFRDYVKRDDDDGERHVRDSLAIYRPATGDSYDYYYDTGGWRRDSRENISNNCDLPNVLVDDLTREKFLSDFVDLSCPFIMRDVGNTWHLKETLRRESLLNEHRDVDLLVGYIPYGEVFGEFNGYATVGEYVDYMDRIAEGNESDNVPLYVFDSGVLESRFVRKNQYSLPDAFDVWKDRDQYHQFILGAPGSGAPFHFHCPAVNVVIYGRKRWFLYPPGLSHYSKIHPQHWLANTYPNAKEGLIECTQHPGDLLFVPSRWSHSVLNVDEVTGIAVEFECNQNQ
ncbi:jmjC domain-containing protein 8-like isoform X2 [Oscarella lobularis]